MNYKNLLRIKLVLALSVSLILPSAVLASPKTTLLPPKARSAADKSGVLAKYGHLAARYLSDCEGLTQQVRPAGDKLKRCLTISKELQDKLTEFVATLETIVQNAKGSKKWTPELDQLFARESGKRGLGAETLSLVRQAGGFRAFYEKSLGEIKASKGEFEREVKELEAKSKESASAQGAVFLTASYEPAAEAGEPRGNRANKWKIVLKVVKAIAEVIVAVCTDTNLCS